MADMENKNPMAEETEVTATEVEAEAVAESPVAEEKVPVATKKQKKKSGKPNVFVRMGRAMAKFWRDYNSERKKIVWKPWRDVCKSAGVVVVSVLVFSAIILGIDTAFDSLFKWVAGLI